MENKEKNPLFKDLKEKLSDQMNQIKKSIEDLESEKEKVNNPNVKKAIDTQIIVLKRKYKKCKDAQLMSSFLYSTSDVI